MPKRLVIARYLSIFIIVCALISWFSYVWALNPGELHSVTYWDGFKHGVLSGVHSQALRLGYHNYSPYVAGILSARPIRSILFMSLVLIALNKRTKAWYITSLISSGLMVLTGNILSLVIFIIFLTKKSREYLLNKGAVVLSFNPSSDETINQ